SVQHSSRIIVRPSCRGPMRPRLVYSLFAVALLAGCVPLEERSAHFDSKWPAANLARLEVSEVNGMVSVEGDSPNEIRMTATVRARGVHPERLTWGAARHSTGTRHLRPSADCFSPRRLHASERRLRGRVSAEYSFASRKPPRVGRGKRRQIYVEDQHSERRHQHR